MCLIGAILRRKLIDLARRAQGEKWKVSSPSISLDAGCQSGWTLFPNEPADDTAGPSTRAYLDEVHELVDRLGPRDRDLVHMYTYLDLTHKQVADQLDVSVSTVKRRWVKTRKRLADVLDSRAPGE